MANPIPALIELIPSRWVVLPCSFLKNGTGHIMKPDPVKTNVRVAIILELFQEPDSLVK